MALLRALSDLLFPPRCQVCRGAGEYPLCARCRAAFRLIRPPLCPTCGRPLPSLPPGRGACSLCRRRRPQFTQARAAGVYEGPLREAVHALKFERRAALAAPLGALLRPLADPLLERIDLVVPVPLHPARLRERGFNQSRLLAEEVVRGARRVPVVDVLARPRQTQVQSSLDVAARSANVRGAFTSRRQLRGARALLVDDVISTGFTASECARALRQGGALDVAVIAVAMAVRNATGEGG